MLILCLKKKGVLFNHTSCRLSNTPTPLPTQTYEQKRTAFKEKLCTGNPYIDNSDSTVLYILWYYGDKEKMQLASIG